MSKNPWIEKRRFPRFKVAELNILRAQVDRTRTRERIVTLGFGGCGFYGFDRNWPWSPMKRVFSTFEIVEEPQVGPIVAQGTIIYIKPLVVNQQQIFFYGVEFIPADRDRLQPLIEQLQVLTAAGRVEIDGNDL